MEDNVPRIIVYNMTQFFNRELFMYSLGDIKFKNPISLKRVAYTTIFFILWTLPLLIIFGIILNVFFLAFALIPPFVLGVFASKPIWGGRGLFDFIKVNFNYLSTPRGWTNLKANNALEKEVLYVEQEIWVSRRRELQLLADIREQREQELLDNKKNKKHKQEVAYT